MRLKSKGMEWLIALLKREPGLNSTMIFEEYQKRFDDVNNMNSFAMKVSRARNHIKSSEGMEINPVYGNPNLVEFEKIDEKTLSEIDLEILH